MKGKSSHAKWYVKFLTALLAVIFSPLLLLLLLIALPHLLIARVQEKRAYRNSPYYADFKRKYRSGIVHSPAYRLYNGAVARRLPARLAALPNRPLYCIYDSEIYLLPDFEQMGLSEEDGVTWQVNYDGNWEDFESAAQKLLEACLKVRNGQSVKILVERNMIAVPDLRKTPPPPCVRVIGSYDKAFENEDSLLKDVIPQSTEELYEMMRETSDLRGEYELTERKDCILWRIREDMQITLSMTPTDCCICIDRLLRGKIPYGVTHWHPSASDMYRDVCEIGKQGHVLVLRSTVWSGTVLYMGKKDECPYPPRKKSLFSTYDYIE